MLCLLLPALDAIGACSTPQDFILPVGNFKNDSACKFGSIQAAIDAAVCPGSTILITPTFTYTAQHLTINSKQLFLYGANKCSDTTTSTPGNQVSISGAGNGGSSVIAIGGNSHVAMQNLFITGSQGGANDYGGGIYFDGDGSLTMANVTVLNNVAGYGGGIYLKGEKNLVALTIGANTLIENNAAYHDGGGIYADQKTALSIAGQNTSVFSNAAYGINGVLGNSNLPRDGYGGGIMLARGAALHLKAAGVAGFGGGAGLGAIDSNKALRGGGIAAVSLDECYSASILTEAPDTLHPVQISNNHASFTGGALYLRPYEPPGPSFCPRSSQELNDFRIASNTAADGAAIYLDWDTTYAVFDKGSAIYLNWQGEDNALPDNPKAKLGTTCTTAPGCNTIEDNAAKDDKGNRTKGSIVFVGISSKFAANRVLVRRNVGDNFIYVRGDNDNYGDTRLSNALIVDNTFARSVVTQENDDAPVYIDSSTIAHNKISGSFALNIHAALTFTDNLLGESVKALDYSGDRANLHVDSVVAMNASGLPIGTTVLQADPMFIDADHGNFALSDKSIALDFAPMNTSLRYDLIGQVRNADLPDVDNRFGARDLGAFERNFNVAAASSGASATASSVVDPAYPPGATIDGDRTSRNGVDSGFWNDGTPSVFPDTLEVDFNTPRTVTKVTVYSLQDDYTHGVEPSDTMAFSLYGLTRFDVQALDPVTLTWTTVGTVTGNNLVKRTVALLHPVDTAAIRVVCDAAADGVYSRIVEVEATGG